MKKIEAVITPLKFDEVKEALTNAKVPSVTFFEVQGTGSRQGRIKQYRGIEYIEDAPEVKFEIIAEDDEAEPVAQIIVGALRTGDLRDGEVAIVPIDSVMRVRIGKCS